MLGIALIRQCVYPLAFTSTLLLPMAFEKKIFFRFSLSFNLGKVYDYFFKSSLKYISYAS